MGHGLSRQQRQILGIAVHANRLTQSGTLAVKTGATVPSYPGSTVDYEGAKDLQWPLAAHLLKGLAFVEPGAKVQKSNGVTQDAGNFFDLTQPAAKSAKASILRAITGLHREGFLTLAPSEYPFRWGYVLTEPGLQRGEVYAMPFAPALLWRAGVLCYPDDTPFFHQIAAWLADGTLMLNAVIDCMAQTPPSPYNHKYPNHDALDRQLSHLLLSVGKSFPEREWYADRALKESAHGHSDQDPRVLPDLDRDERATLIAQIRDSLRSTEPH